MEVISGLDEAFNSVFSSLAEKMVSKNVTLDDVKALLLRHKSRLEGRNIIHGSSLPYVNISLKIDDMNPISQQMHQMGVDG